MPCQAYTLIAAAAVFRCIIMIYGPNLGDPSASALARNSRGQTGALCAPIIVGGLTAAAATAGKAASLISASSCVGAVHTVRHNAVLWSRLQSCNNAIIFKTSRSLLCAPVEKPCDRTRA